MSTTAQSYFGNGPNASNTENLYHDDTSLTGLDVIMWIYILPVLIGIGTIGNVLSIAVIKKSKLGNTSIGFYMFVYAIVGLLCLYRYGIDWLCSVMEWQKPEDISEWGCRFLQFIYRVVTYSGMWILVSALVDRYISVCHYRSAQAMCQLFMAKVAVSIVMIGVIVVSVHAMWSYSLHVYLGKQYCIPMREDLYAKVWRWMSACCYSFIPLIALLVLSLLLVCGMCARHRGATIPVQDDVPVDLTCTILVLSILFLIAALPTTIVNIVDFTVQNHAAINVERLSIARTVTNFIQCGNNVFLFFVLSFSSSSFRQEMKQTFAGILTKIRQRNILNDLKHSNSRNSDRLAIEIHSNDTLL